MNDPAVIPWDVVWLGLILLVVGTGLVAYDVNRPRPNRLTTAGAIAVALGIGLIMGPLVVNGYVILAKAFCAVTHEVALPTSSGNNAYPQR